MVRGAWQEPDEARGKWLRARITSTQLSTYYVGSLEMWDLELEMRRRAAVAVGASVDAVPGQHIAGGLGDTPGFDQRAHLEAVISHGTPAIKWLPPHPARRGRLSELRPDSPLRRPETARPRQEPLVEVEPPSPDGAGRHRASPGDAAALGGRQRP